MAFGDIFGEKIIYQKDDRGASVTTVPGKLQSAVGTPITYERVPQTAATAEPKATEPTTVAPTTPAPATPGASLKDQQAAQLAGAEADLLKLQEQADALAAREGTAAGDAVATDTSVIEDEKKATENIGLAELNDPTRAQLDLLDAQIDRIDAQLKGEIDSINKTFDVIRGKQEGEQEGERGTTSVGLAQAGGYLGFSGSGTGVMLSLAKSHRAELADLAAKRQAAIAAAKAAAEGNRMTLVRDKAREIAAIDQETYNRQQDYNDRVRKEAEAEVARKEEAKIQTDIFNAIETSGSNTPKDIFRALKGSVSIEEINSFLENLSPGSAGDFGFKFTSSETAKLLGSGMAPDDIRAVHEYVNENGYTEELRSMLSPRELAAMDDVFRKKTGADGELDTAFTLADGSSISSTTMQIIDGFQTLDRLTPSTEEDVMEELYAMGFGGERPSWFDDQFVEGIIGVPLTLENLEEIMRFNTQPGKETEMRAKAIKQLKDETWDELNKRIFKGKKSTGGSVDDIDYTDLEG